MKESIIQRSVMDYLRMVEKQQGLYFFRANSGAFKTERGNFVKTGKAGLSDIVCIQKKPDHARILFLEVKNEKGRQSKTQKEAEEAVTYCGAEYHIIRSIGDIKRVIEL